MGELLTVYASIGNSDDKLTQAQWAEFHQLFTMLVRRAAEHVHGDWLSATNSPWQNACMCFEIQPDAAARLKTVLAEAAGEFGQESIAWAVAETEFVAPPADRRRREPRAAQYQVGGLGPVPTAFDTEARTITEAQAARDYATRNTCGGYVPGTVETVVRAGEHTLPRSMLEHPED